jgi:imidazolonepropionase-like amidohydrolase
MQQGGSGSAGIAGSRSTRLPFWHRATTRAPAPTRVPARARAPARAPARARILGQVLVVVFAAVPAAAVAQQTPTALVGARILPVAGAPIDEGVLLVHEGRVVAVGGAGSVVLPAGAISVDVRGKTIIPGLVDTHTHVGGGWGGDESAPLQPDVRVLDSVDCRDSGFQRAQAGGITTANVMAGSGHLMAGQTVYLKLRDANTVEAMTYRDAEGAIAYGMKMANGTNSQRDPPFPGTRSKSAALVREQFVRAQVYRDKLALAGDDATKRPDRDLNLEALVELLEGRRIVQHHTHRHDDVMTVLRLRSEFGFRVVLHHVSEAAKVAAEIAAAQVPVSLIMIDTPGGKIEAADFDPAAGGILERAGALVAFHTDDWINDSRLFLRSGALAVRNGMSPEGALAALTLNGAKMLDLDARIGSLEPGKDADFVVLSGEPFSVYTQVLQTWVEGAPVFDRERPDDRVWAEGGWGAGQRRALGGCCFEREELR